VISWENIIHPTEKLDDKILRKYVRQYIDDIFVEFGEQPSIHLILINIDTRQYFFHIFQYFTIHQLMVHNRWQKINISSIHLQEGFITIEKTSVKSYKI
jgi:hypothetical protein